MKICTVMTLPFVMFAAENNGPAPAFWWLKRRIAIIALFRKKVCGIYSRDTRVRV